MYLKKLRNNRVALVESRYVRKGTDGNTHGYSATTTLCRLSAEATSLPTEWAKRLTEDQLRYLEEKLLAPNRRREAEEKAAAEARAKDPRWRLQEAARLVAEARMLCQQKTVDTAAIAAVRSELDALQPPTKPSVPAPTRPEDPLKAAIDAVRAAARAVASDHYGVAPKAGVRETTVYRLWQDLNEAVSGAGTSSLLAALQSRDWVKKKQKT